MPDIVSNLIELYLFKKIHGEPKYLLLKRAADVVFPNIWQMVSGTIESNEKAYETAFRELYEETGFKTDKLYVVPKISEFYYQQKDTLNLVPIFLAELNEETIKLSKEHVEYGWFDFVDAYQNLHWITWKDNLELINDILKDEIKYKNLEEIFIN